nr:hypothetical protein [Tanacetum cinerariifolium]
MLTAMKSVGSLPTHRLASRYPSDSSLSDSSSRHSSSGYTISETPCDSPTVAFERISHKRCMSPSAPVSSHVRKALSPISADLSPPPKRIRDSNSVTDLQISLEDGSHIDECIAYADAIRARGMDDRDVVETASEEEVKSKEKETRLRLRLTQGSGQSSRMMCRFHDHDVEILVHWIQVIESEQRLQGHRITGVDLEVTTTTKRIDTFEQDNMRLRGMLDVESQRVDQLQRGLSHAQRELRQMSHF